VVALRRETEPSARVIFVAISAALAGILRSENKNTRAYRAQQM